MPVTSRDLPPNHERRAKTDAEHPYEPLVDALLQSAVPTRRVAPPPAAVPAPVEEVLEDDEDGDEDEEEAAPPPPPPARRMRGGSDRLEQFIDPPRPARPTRPPSETAMVRGETVDWLITWAIRLGCLILLSLTFSGTVLALNGGWNIFVPPILKGIPSGADPGQALQTLLNWNTFWMIMTWKTQVGIGIQLVITGIQFNHRTRKVSFWYIMSMIISAGLTYSGFSDIAVPVFAVFFALFMAAQWATIAAHGFLFGLSVWSDFAPEHSLIK